MSQSDAYPELLLKHAHKRTFRNEQTLRASEEAGCFYCCETYPAGQVTEWVRENDSGRTAVCPRCGIDSVLGSSAGFPLTAEFLQAMHDYWFED
jgi:ssDNA-binding Zn-finger/Zn-ribbon topoisomerase 1